MGALVPTATKDGETDRGLTWSFKVIAESKIGGRSISVGREFGGISLTVGSLLVCPRGEGFSEFDLDGVCGARVTSSVDGFDLCFSALAA